MCQIHVSRGGGFEQMRGMDKIRPREPIGSNWREFFFFYRVWVDGSRNNWRETTFFMGIIGWKRFFFFFFSFIIEFVVLINNK